MTVCDRESEGMGSRVENEGTNRKDEGRKRKEERKKEEECTKKHRHRDKFFIWETLPQINSVGSIAESTKERENVAKEGISTCFWCDYDAEGERGRRGKKGGKDLSTSLRQKEQPMLLLRCFS